jgi:uncharacterized protein YpuA (DUF1002 family)
MGKVIYGVDLDKKITPIIVRDAIIRCFVSAHKEVLDQMRDCVTFRSQEEFEKMKEVNVTYLVKSIFTENRMDFNNPTKDDLIIVINKLAEIAKNFRSPEIIKKHYNEIKELIDRL